MKLLFAYDGSGISRSLIKDLRISGLPEKAGICMISVSEVWLPPQIVSTDFNSFSDHDVTEYFRKHSEQMERNLARTKEILFEAKAELQKYFPKWNIETKASTGSPAAEILLKAFEFKPELIVIGSQGLSWDRIRRLGSISQKVLTESNCPVRIARTKRDSDFQCLKIAVCFDGSNGSLEAVKTVALRRWQGNPEIRLMTVTDPLIALIPGRAFQVIPGLEEDRMTGEKRWVESLAEKALEILHNAGHNASLKIYSGNPRLVLINETDDWGADLIFIGANSDLSQKNTLGSVASAVAIRSSCTIEVVRLLSTRS